MAMPTPPASPADSPIPMRSRAKPSIGLHRPVDQEGDEPRPEAGRLEVERHRLGGDHRRCSHHDVPYRQRWTSTPTSAPTSPSGPGSTSSPPAPAGAWAGCRRPSSTSWSSSTCGCRPTCPTPGPSTATPPSPRPSPAGWPAPAPSSTAPASRTLRAVGRFFAVTFPAALWHVRHFVASQRGPAVRARPRLRDLDRQLAHRPGGHRPRGGARGLRRRTTSRTTTPPPPRPPSPPRSSPTTCGWRSSPSPAGSRSACSPRPSSSSTGPTWAWPRACSRPSGRRPSSGDSSCPTACSS